MDPLWNSLVVGGVSGDGAPFLGTVGMVGTSYTDATVATGEHPAQPLRQCCGRVLRRRWGGISCCGAVGIVGASYTDRRVP